MKKKFISFLLAFSCLFSIFAFPAHASTLSDKNARIFALSEIANFSTTLDNKAIWTSNAKIYNSIPLYSPDNIISGYIYFLSTEGKDSGYIQIHKSSDSYITVNLGYNDNSILTELASNYSTSFNNKLLHNSKIYFCGDYNYFIDLDNAILDLSNKTLLEKNNETFTQLSSLYQHFIAKFTNIAFLDSADDPGNSGGATVRDLHSAMNYLRTMHYYESQYSSNLDSHCSPTAAANLIIYWRYGRGFSNLQSSQLTIFSKMHELMGTTNEGGTENIRIAPAIQYYLNNYAASYATSLNSTTYVTFSKIKNAISLNCPLLVSVSNWNSGSSMGHSINVWGYSIASGGNYLYITDNSGASNVPSFRLINYSLYTYSNSMYITMI